MLAKEIIKIMESLAPAYLIDEWDNSGLQIGDENKEIKKIIVALDVTPNVISQAVESNVDMIITHHPFFFDKLNQITPNTSKGSMIYDIIKEEIVIYSAHSNLDTCYENVSYVLGHIIGLENIEVLSKTYEEKLYKLVVFAPTDYSNQVRKAITDEGAGWIGGYSHCTYNTNGIGTFMPREGTNPFIGKYNQIEEVQEVRIETIVREGNIKSVVDGILRGHPYEEVAYDLYPLSNKGTIYGYGSIGNLKKPIKLLDLSKQVKEKLKCNSIRVFGNCDTVIKRVAVCGGRGADFIKDAKIKLADLYITGDIKFHDAQLAGELDLPLIDANHYNTEIVVLPHIKQYLEKTIPHEKIEILISEDNSSPFRIL